MPNPTAPPPPRESTAPANLDELVRRAMTGKGGVDAIKKALSDPAPLPRVDAPPPRPEAPSTEVPRTEAPRPEAASSDPLEQLALLVTRARASRDQGDMVAYARALEAAAETLARLRGEPAGVNVSPGASEVPLPEPERPRVVRLGPSRLPYALVMGEVPPGMETAVLASALGVDLATARAATLAGGTRIVIRSGDRPDLAARATRLSAAGVTASVADRDTLSAMGMALAVTGADSLDVLRVVEAELWISPPDPGNLPRGEPWVLAAPTHLVPGEVELRRLRADVEDSRWQRKHYAAAKGAGGETRLAVLDIHDGGRILRLVEGACELGNVQPGSSRVAMKALLERLSARWPSARVEPRRVCAAQPVPGDNLREDGWGAWEEHSRAVAALQR